MTTPGLFGWGYFYVCFLQPWPQTSCAAAEWQPSTLSRMIVKNTAMQGHYPRQKPSRWWQRRLRHQLQALQHMYVYRSQSMLNMLTLYCWLVMKSIVFNVLCDSSGPASDQLSTFVFTGHSSGLASSSASNLSLDFISSTAARMSSSSQLPCLSAHLLRSFWKLLALPPVPSFGSALPDSAQVQNRLSPVACRYGSIHTFNARNVLLWIPFRAWFVHRLMTATSITMLIQYLEES